MSGSLLKFEKRYSVKIGGRRYPAVKIGNQLWMAENLDYQWSGLPVNDNKVSSSPKGYYFDNTTEYGLYYNYYAVLSMQGRCPEGWKIPTKSDVETLISVVGDSSSKKLRSTTSWITNGTDDYGFNFKSNGSSVNNGGNLTNYRQTQWGLFWTCTQNSSLYSYAFIATYDSINADLRTIDNQSATAIRLVKSLD